MADGWGVVFPFLIKESGMRSVLDRIGLSALVAATAVLFCFSPARAQGGEPQYLAIRGAKVVPVSGPPIENATVVIARGVITAVGTDAKVPDEAWVIDGKGLTVYPGLIDAFTDIGIPTTPAATPAEAPPGGRRAIIPGVTARGPEDRPS